jgi:hypothetical protein
LNGAPFPALHFKGRNERERPAVLAGEHFIAAASHQHSMRIVF